MKKVTKLFTLSLLSGSMVFFASCGDDDNGGGGSQKDGEITAQNDPDMDPNGLAGNITADVTITLEDSPWVLSGPLAVKSGATLTIEAGVEIQAVAGGTNTYLVVETGAMINAAGTSTNPIVFTSSATNPRNGDWGGVLINGLAPISGGGTSTTEVLPLSYGGTDPDDNSGVFKYVILEYTGARINGEKEFNGLTLYAVGSETEINNIMINGGDDDAIEWFGGTVSVDNLLVINPRDDMFDWTQGWTGSGSNWYGIREDGFTAISEDTRGIEADGNLDGNNPEQSNQSNPSIDKITIVNAASAPAISFADMVKVRRGSGAQITNMMLAKIGSAGFSDLVDCTDAKGDAAEGTSISYWYNDALTPAGIKPGANNATLNQDPSATGATTVDWSWTGYSFPTLTPASVPDAN